MHGDCIVPRRNTQLLVDKTQLVLKSQSYKAIFMFMLNLMTNEWSVMIFLVLCVILWSARPASWPDYLVLSTTIWHVESTNKVLITEWRTHSLYSMSRYSWTYIMQQHMIPDWDMYTQSKQNIDSGHKVLYFLHIMCTPQCKRYTEMHFTTSNADMSCLSWTARRGNDCLVLLWVK